MVRRFQGRTQSPKRLRNYLVNLCTRIRSFVSGSHPDLQGRSAFEQVHGWTPDISLYVMHGWYEVVSYLESDNERKLACWLGPAEDYGGGDTVFLLPKTAKPIVRSTVWSLTPDERVDKKEEIEHLLQSIQEKIGDDRTNDEVYAELGNDILPHVDLFGDVDDATQGDFEGNRADAQDYTPGNVRHIPEYAAGDRDRPRRRDAPRHLEEPKKRQRRKANRIFKSKPDSRHKGVPCLF
ncbi:hypothetical protein MHU86_10292 [Fragilaria crotonensis]|nr:hypothetical protein MHU86_10292 [Fragilaria crotonensis]